MKRVFLAFVVGAMAGAFAAWYIDRETHKDPLTQARDSVTGAANRVKASVQEKISEIRTEDIKRELERGGLIVREKATKVGAAISDATANARTTAVIKGKLLKEPGLSSLSINVDTTDGLVTLSGTVPSHEEVAKAVRLAMETEGVTKVVSTLQVKPGK